MKELKLGNTDLVALVDDDDFIRFNPFNWGINENGYVVADSSKPRRRLGVSCKVRLHRLIMACPGGRDVDHQNGNKLDNQKSNLRICTRGENLANKMPDEIKLEGAYKTREGRYTSFLSLNNRGMKNKMLGVFKTAEEAHAAFVKAHLEFYGEFSKYNRGKNEDIIS